MIYNYWLIIVCALALSMNSFGQDSNYCILVDSVSKEPVAYASISTGSFYVHSDEQGRFPVNDIPKNIFHINRLGYEALMVSKSELKDTLFLTPLSYSIQEVVVSANRKPFEVGYHKLRTVGIAHGTNLQRAGVYISHPGRPAKIVRIMVATHGNRRGMEYNIYLFETTPQGDPGSLIYSGKYTSHNGRNFLEIPLEDVAISMPDKGVVVVVGWTASLGNEMETEKYATIKLTKAIDEANSFLFYKNVWGKKDYPEVQPPLNYKIGLELQPE